MEYQKNEITLDSTVVFTLALEERLYNRISAAPKFAGKSWHDIARVFHAALDREDIDVMDTNFEDGELVINLAADMSTEDAESRAKLAVKRVLADL